MSGFRCWEESPERCLLGVVSKGMKGQGVPVFSIFMKQAHDRGGGKQRNIIIIHHVARVLADKITNARFVGFAEGGHMGMGHKRQIDNMMLDLFLQTERRTIDTYD